MYSRIKNGIAWRGGGVSFQVYREAVYSECRANKNSTSIINSLTISNTLITGNVASEQGGGYYGVISNLCQKYRVTLTSVNFTDKATIYCMLVSHWGLPQEVMRAGGPLPLWHYFCNRQPRYSERKACCDVLAYERLR